MACCIALPPAGPEELPGDPHHLQHLQALYGPLGKPFTALCPLAPSKCQACTAVGPGPSLSLCLPEGSGLPCLEISLFLFVDKIDFNQPMPLLKKVNQA